MPMNEEAAKAVIAAKLEDLGFPPATGENSDKYPTWKIAEAIAALIPYIQENATVAVDPHSSGGPATGKVT